MTAHRSAGRTGLLLAATGSALLLPAILVSKSTTGVVFGRYSAALAGAALLDLLFLAFMVFLLFRPGPRERIARSAARMPDLPVLLLFLFPLPLFLLLWFLFPFALLDRWNAFLGTCLILVSPGVFLVGSREGDSRRDAARGIAAGSISLLVCLIAAELAVRAVVPGSYFDPRLGLIPFARHTLMVDLPGVTPGGTLTTNRWGLRGEEPPENWDAWTTLVTIGGSTTADYYLDDSLTWSAVLQETLREADPLTWVGNGGIPRHSTETHVLFLREVVAEIQPDVVVFLVGINDIGQFMKGSLAQAVPPLADGGPRVFLFRHSRLLQVLYKARKVYVEGAMVISENADPDFERIPMTGPEAVLPDDLGELLPDPKFYEKRIVHLIEVCRELDVTAVFLTQPLLYDDTDYWRGIQGGCSWILGTDSIFSAATNWRMLDHLNRQLIEVCEQEGVACFDLASGIPHDSTMFYDAMHFTEAGSDRIGRLTGAYLLDHRIVQPR